MKYEIMGADAFPMLKVSLDAGQTVKAESNAMVSMSEGMELKGRFEGGAMQAIARKFAGESFFLQHITATTRPGWVMLAPFLPGTMEAVEVKGETLCVQKGSFLAAGEDFEISSKVQNIAKGFFSGEGFFITKARGVGPLFLSSYGGIERIDLAMGEKIIVDNGHLVAWDETLNYGITKGASGWFSAFTSGEILALEFTGPGRVWIQSRNLKDFSNWMISLMPQPRRG